MTMFMRTCACVAFLLLHLLQGAPAFSQGQPEASPMLLLNAGEPVEALPYIMLPPTSAFVGKLIISVDGTNRSCTATFIRSNVLLTAAHCVQKNGTTNRYVGDETPVEPLPHEDVAAAIERLNEAIAGLKGELGKVIVGQEQVIEELLIAIFARGHCLLVGVPGLAKTLMIRTLADALSLSFSRIQFTPDLMPSDITGTEVIAGGQGDRAARCSSSCTGPIFANVILADEINRTPPKTQAALLEAMQEHQVTVGGKRHRLPEPFFVLATQNPIEQEGTYPLPEAQLDRFMFNILVDYPTEEEEFQIVELTTLDATAAARARARRRRTSWSCRRSSARCRCADHVDPLRDEVHPADAPQASGDVPDFVNDYVSWGAGPRASQYLILAAKARAVLHGRYYVTTRGHPRGRPAGAAAPHHHQLQRRGRGRQARRDRRAG